MTVGSMMFAPLGECRGRCATHCIAGPTRASGLVGCCAEQAARYAQASTELRLVPRPAW
jgi:hypothetical protein